jgi:nitrate reductase NapE component
LSPLKRRIVQAWLIAFAVWPAVHIGLVKAWGVNPWKLMGWGMYSAPQMPAELRISGVRTDGSTVSLTDELPEDLDADRYAFLRARLGLGSLVRPARLARAIFDRDPSLEGLTIDVDQPVLDRRTGLIDVRTSRYTYRR